MMLYPGNASQLDEAEVLLREAIDCCRRTLGPDHLYTLNGLHDLAGVLWWKGRQEEAVALRRQAYEGRRRTLGLEHADTLRSMSRLGLDLLFLGKFEEAEPLCRRSLESRRHVLGLEHIETLWGEWALCELLTRKGEHAEAEKLARHCLETSRRVLGANHSDTVDYLATLGEVLCNARRPAEAEPLLRECLRQCESRPSSQTAWFTSTPYARGLLGFCLARQGKLAEAEPLLLASYEGLTSVKYVPPYQVNESLGYLIELYEKWGKPEQAEAWRKKRPPAGK
jgi:tetratricopeptide (TPR) repeat protein